MITLPEATESWNGKPEVTILKIIIPLKTKLEITDRWR